MTLYEILLWKEKIEELSLDFSFRPDSDFCSCENVSKLITALPKIDFIR